MQIILFFILYFVVTLFKESVGKNVNYKLHLITCETRNSKEIEFWMMTAKIINNVYEIKNICENKEWKGLSMKVAMLLEYLEELKQKHKQNNDNNLIELELDNNLILFLDGGDAYFNVLDSTEIITNYEKIRGNKSIIFSAEQTCWTGNICSVENAEKLFPDTHETTSQYLNSGAYIGTLSKLHALVTDVDAYYKSEKPHRRDFDDQGAFVEVYSKKRIWNQEILLDTHWNIFGQLQIVKAHDTTPDLPKFDAKKKLAAHLTCISHVTMNHTKDCYQINVHTKDMLSMVSVNGTIPSSEGSSNSGSACMIYFKLKGKYEAEMAPIFNGLNSHPLVLHNNGKYKQVYGATVNWKSACLKQLQQLQANHLISRVTDEDKDSTVTMVVPTNTNTTTTTSVTLTILSPDSVLSPPTGSSGITINQSNNSINNTSSSNSSITKPLTTAEVYSQSEKKEVKKTQQTVQEYATKVGFSLPATTLTSDESKDGSRSKGQFAFLFITRGVMPHEELWRRFFSAAPTPNPALITSRRLNTNPLFKGHSVFVHPPQGFSYPVNSLFYSTELPEHMRQKVTWGGISEVLAMKALYMQALNDVNNQYFLLYSESCIPLHSLPKMEHALLTLKGNLHPNSNSNARSIVNACPQSSKDSKIVHWDKSLQLQANITAHLWRKSEQWTALTRTHTVLIATDKVVLDAFATIPGGHLRFTDEHYTATLLALHSYGNETCTTCAGGFTATDWSHPPHSRKPVHPKEYRAIDISKLIEAFLLKEREWNHGIGKKMLGKISRQFGHGPAIEGGCSGTYLCHFNARKMVHASDVTHALILALNQSYYEVL